MPAFATGASLAGVDLQMLVIKGLAVAGGALVGYLGGGWSIRLLCRLLFHSKVPPRVVTMIRLLGMAAMGMLVYLWVFGASTAGGLGGGGGWWPFGGKAGQGDNQAESTGIANGASPSPAEPPAAEPPNRLATQEPRLMQVRLLGGVRVIEQRFYQVEGEKQPLTWIELRKVLEERCREEPPLKVIEIVLFKDSVDRDNPAVTQLESWAKENSVMLKVAFPDREGGREDVPGPQ